MHLQVVQCLNASGGEGDYHIQLRDKPRVFECGRTPYRAMARLVEAFPEEFKNVTEFHFEIHPRVTLQEWAKRWM